MGAQSMAQELAQQQKPRLRQTSLRKSAEKRLGQRQPLHAPQLTQRRALRELWLCCQRREDPQAVQPGVTTGHIGGGEVGMAEAVGHQLVVDESDLIAQK